MRGGGRPSPDCRSPGLTYPVCLSGHHIYLQSHESSLKCHKRNTEKTVSFDKLIKQHCKNLRVKLVQILVHGFFFIDSGKSRGTH